MKMMGLPSWMHWICWFINCIGVSTISIIIMVLLVSLEFKSGTGAVLDYSNPFLIFLFLFLYASSLICFLFIISTFFDRRESGKHEIFKYSFHFYSQPCSVAWSSCSHPLLYHPQQFHQQNCGQLC